MDFAPLFSAGTESLFKGVRMFGAVTVAFFILLFAMLVAFFYGGTKMLGQQEVMVQQASAQDQQLNRMEQKIDNAISDSQADRALNAYFLKQICLNGANTEFKQQGCNPPPSLLQPK